MANFYNMFMSFALIGLVVTSLLAFGISFQQENEAPSQFAENTLINGSFNEFRNNLIGDGTTSKELRESFEEDRGVLSFGALLLLSVINAGKTFGGMVSAVFNILIELPVVIFGIDPVIVAVLSTMLIISIIIGLWIMYKVGG